MASSLSALPRLEHYVLTERLGQGTYAVVYKAYKKVRCRRNVRNDKKSTNSQGNRREAVAVKYIKRSSLTKRATDNLMTEIEILKRLKHRHIVELYDFEARKNNNSIYENRAIFQWDAHGIYLIMEFCGGGDLSDFIRSRKTLPEKVARKFVRQLGIIGHSKNPLETLSYSVGAQFSPRAKHCSHGLETPKSSPIVENKTCFEISRLSRKGDSSLSGESLNSFRFWICAVHEERFRYNGTSGIAALYGSRDVSL